MAKKFSLSLHRRFTRFFIVGGVNTIFGFSVYSACIFVAVSVPHALLVSMILGTLFNFLFTGKYVFSRFSLGFLPRYLICYFFIYAINVYLFDIVFIWLSNKIATQAVLVFPLAILSYFLMNKFVFNNSKK